MTDLAAIMLRGVSHWREPASRGHACCSVWFTSQVGGPVSSSLCGSGFTGSRDAHVSWVFLIFSSGSETFWNLRSVSPQTVNNPSSARSLCPCFLGHEAVKFISVVLASVKGGPAGGDPNERLSCLKYSGERDLGSPLWSQSELNKGSASANKYSRDQSGECCTVFILTFGSLWYTPHRPSANTTSAILQEASRW